MELRKAEMEAQKAENMVAYEAEISARPPRTWFQTVKEKVASIDRCAHATPAVMSTWEQQDVTVVKTAHGLPLIVLLY